ncbi:MAG: hypothetical protein ACRDUA_00490, partial [Micromonosporaceae bacterium]
MLTRRELLLAGTMGTLAIMVPSAAHASPNRGRPGTGPVLDPKPSGGPPTVTPDDITFQRRTLRAGPAEQVGLLPEQIGRMKVDMTTYLEPTEDHPNYPSYAGAVVLGAKDGVIVEHS